MHSVPKWLSATLTLKEVIYIRTPIIILVGVNVHNFKIVGFAIWSISTEQQITLYPHIDDNNDWRIINATQDNQPEIDWMNYPELVYITSGSRVKLRHVSTEKNLHSHDFRPPVSEVEFQNEVSAYGLPGFAGDLNDDWVVEIEKGDKRDPESGHRVRTLGTQFRLRHALSGCYLFSHKVKLPTWGYEQQEVTCNKNAVKTNSLWVIESSNHPNRKSTNLLILLLSLTYS
jgi:dolichyl-phosphate-mannose-protein mannosyltransferase